MKLENETVWLTQAQMADLKSTVRLLSNVIEHKQLPLFVPLVPGEERYTV
ncbi:MAG: hypothetical protein V8Q99_17760 [Bacteroides ovatus]